jgi:predicted Ser/Thr protein kinase
VPSVDPEPLVRLFETLGLDRTARVSPDATLRPGAMRGRAAGDTTAAPSRSRGGSGTTAPFLPTITLGERVGPSDADPPSADLVLGARLGEGGMGVVDAASQRSLGREVALKRPQGESSAAALVEEARVMALVEHPNVVPVFALGRDAAEQPVLVMKRIHGASMKALLRDPAHAAWPRLEARWGDRERALLAILGEVCDALTLAHSHGIVHRDVKPENVMVGEFGEVYLLDWGIAHRVNDAALAGDGNVVGTPGYMAPEMVLEADLADARTDVYLLGATLHEVLTGRMRHEGESFFEILASALESRPFAYGPEVPEDLAALANAATARDPAERPESAAAFRRALTDHERHREALTLVKAAREATARASQLEPGSPEAIATLSEAGAALAAAERVFAESTALAAAKEAHIRALVAREIALESPRAARALLPRLTTPDASLEASIAVLEKRMEQARERDLAAQRARAEADTWGSLRARVAASVVAFLVFMGVVLAQWLRHPTMPTVRGFFQNDVIVLVVLALLMIVFRTALFANAGNRKLTLVVYGALVFQTLVNGAAMTFGLPAPQAMVFGFTLVTGWFCVVSITVHRGFALPSACAALVGGLVFVWPSLAPRAALLGTLLVLLAIFAATIRAMRDSRVADDAGAAAAAPPRAPREHPGS